MRAISITQCEVPRGCQPGPWWRYEVSTGRNQAVGYAPGTKKNARSRATAALHALERMEGKPLRARGPKQRRAGHDVRTCNCRLCANARHKNRLFARSKAKRGLGAARVRRAIAADVVARVTRAQR